MESNVKLEKKPVVRWHGITRCSKLLGISRTHLSRVMHGERSPGKNLEKRMRKIGLKPGSAA